METRARYILVGAFTLISVLAAMGFLLWLARVQINRTYAQYDIVFDTVAGLSQASVVRYNGVDVGKVLTIALDRNDPALGRVRIEIFHPAPRLSLCSLRREFSFPQHDVLADTF